MLLLMTSQIRHKTYSPFYAIMSLIYCKTWHTIYKPTWPLTVPLIYDNYALWMIYGQQLPKYAYGAYSSCFPTMETWKHVISISRQFFTFRIKLNALLVVKFKCTMPESGGCGSSSSSSSENGSHAKSNGVVQLRKNFLGVKSVLCNWFL